MTISPRLRKLVLSVHLTCSVGWIGAVLAYLALGIAAATSEDDRTIRASWIALELTGWYVIVPMALASLATGIAMALATRWGLFRHYWVLVSLGLTVFATAILLLHMPSVSTSADVARAAGSRRLEALGGDLLHPAVGLVVLLVVLALNVFKPPGVTGYGRRKHAEERRRRDGARSGGAERQEDALAARGLDPV